MPGSLEIFIIKGYRTSSTIYLYLHKQLQIPNELVSSGCRCSCIHHVHKIVEQVRYIIYLLVHF